MAHYGNSRRYITYGIDFEELSVISNVGSWKYERYYERDVSTETIALSLQREYQSSGFDGDASC